MIRAECDETAVARDYRRNVPIAKIRRRYGICQRRLYEIIRTHAAGRRYEMKKQDRVKNRRIGKPTRCACCGAAFVPYTLDGQYCRRLCLECWQMFSDSKCAF